MRIKTLLFLAVAMAFAVALFGCGGEQTQSETPTPQAEETMAEMDKPADAYPIDFCVVSGEKLGSMGDPYKHEYNGRTVMFCCGGCVEEFESAPARYIAKLDSAAAGMLDRDGDGHDHDHDAEGHEGHDHS